MAHLAYRVSSGTASRSSTPSAEDRSHSRSKATNSQTQRPEVFVTGGGVPGVNEETYVSAWELEMWRRAEEAKWLANLKERETMHVAALEKEWKTREKKRSDMIARRQHQFDELEARLKTALQEVEKRERQLVVAEEDQLRWIEAGKAEHALKMEELDIAHHRMKADFEAKADIEKKKTEEFNQRYLRMQEQWREEKEDKRQLSADFEQYKRDRDAVSEANLLGQIAKLKVQNEDLSHKLEEETDNHRQCQDKLKKCVIELNRMKQKYDQEIVQTIRREKEELSTLRKQRLQEEEARLTQLAEMRRMEEIREEVKHHLKVEAGEEEGPGVLEQYKDETHLAANSEQIRRLKLERKHLLSTGVYDEDDKVIKQIDARLSLLKALKHNPHDPPPTA